MNRLLAPHLATSDLDGAIRDYFVGVHVRLRATAGLPDAQREVIVKLASDDLVGSLEDKLAFLFRKLAKVAVHQRAGFLEDAEGAGDFARHDIAADVEMDERTRGLGAVVTIGGHLDGAHAVGFSAGFHVHSGPAV